MINEIILIILAFIWLIIAIIQDFRKKEIENFHNFSIIILVLSFRLFVSIFSLNYNFFLFGFLSFIICFFLAHIFYNARIFAGGDAKLLLALSPIIPLASTFYTNLIYLVIFIFLIFLSGSIYTLIYSLILIPLNFSKIKPEFKKQINNHKKTIIFSLVISIILLIISILINQLILIFIPLLLILFIILLIYTKSIENSCFILNIKTSKLRPGDWLNKTIKIKNKTIKPSWHGLTTKQIKLIQKHKSYVSIKTGIPFSPSFLIAFIFLLLLRYSSWSLWQFFS